MVKKISELYQDARHALLVSEDAPTAGMMARNLLCMATGKTPEQLVADRELYASQEACDTVRKAVERLQEGEPLAYVLGEWDFYGLTLYVDKNVLIPRDDTCALAEMVIRKVLFMDQDPRVLDLCTGSGCIGLAIANKVKDARVTLADISREAMAVAKKNIQRHHMGGRVNVIAADALGKPSAFLGKFDMIVSNPPYITTEEMTQLQPSVKDFEPVLALHGGDDGLEFYRAIAKNYADALKPGGYLAFEFGMGQGDDVCRILEENGYTVLERTKDYNNIERAVLAQYGRKEVV